MSLIKVSKGLHSGRRNRILMETIEFQERLFKRMQENDFPLFEKIKMAKIIKSNIEEFCHLKLGKANARTLNLIIRKIIHLYHGIGMYLTIEINRCNIEQLIDHSIKDGLFARHYDPVTIIYEDRIKTKNKDNCPNNLSFIFVEYGREIDNISFDQFVIPTPKIIFGVDELVRLIDSKPQSDLMSKYSFPVFRANDNMCSFNNDAKMLDTDVIFRTPYDSYDIVLRFMDSKFSDPTYHTFLMTLYRTATQSKIVDMLCKYAQIFKTQGGSRRLFVYVETTASGNEELNRNIIDQLSKAGVCVIYGSEYKVHAKMFIAIGNSGYEMEMCAHFSTGNYNEASARAYTDIQLLTKDKSKILPAINTFYRFIWGKTSITEDVRPTNCIWFSPNNLKSTLIGLFREQIQLGANGKIVIKANSIADAEIVEYIHEAAMSGVNVHVICRSICLIDPEYLIYPNLIIESYCGRWLEHDRIYGFGDRWFIASADLSFRNLHKRVESFIEMTDRPCIEFLEKTIENMPISNPYKFVMTREGNWEIRSSADN